MTIRRFLPFLTVLAMPLLVGSSCAIFFSSGGGSGNRDDKEKDPEQIIVANSGIFGEVPTQGVSYESGALSGTTDSTGAFHYEVGKPVRFFIGAVALGEPVAGKSLIAARDLVPEGATDTPAVINISRLLLSLDSQPNDDGITIPAAVRSAAVRSNPNVASAIEFLDFADDLAFTNAASQLLATLTSDYPFTATLVDGKTAQERMKKRL